MNRVTRRTGKGSDTSDRYVLFRPPYLYASAVHRFHVRGCTDERGTYPAPWGHPPFAVVEQRRDGAGWTDAAPPRVEDHRHERAAAIREARTRATAALAARLGAAP